MSLFSRETETEYQQIGTKYWKNQGEKQREPIIRGEFYQKGTFEGHSSIEYGVDDQSIFFYQDGKLRSLDLCMMVMEQHFYLRERQRIYQLKLKNQNTLTILYTPDFNNFINFYAQLARFCILTTFERHFRIGEVLGTGTFGQVYTGYNIFSKQEVALKIFKKSKINQVEDGLLVIMNEIKNLEKLRRYHLSPLMGVYETDDCVVLVEQKAEAGNMIDYIKMQSGHYDGELVRVMMKKILENLKQLHSAGFIHRDIKPENILFNSSSLKSSLFLGDFGLTIEKKQSHNNVIARKCSGTLGFIAPQVIHDNKYDEKCDIFSLGCLFYYLHKGQCLFYDKTIKEIYSMTNDFKAIQRKIQSLKNLNPVSEDLMRKLLSINPQDRPSALEILKHDYFANMQSYKVWTGEQDCTLREYIIARIDKYYG